MDQVLKDQGFFVRQYTSRSGSGLDGGPMLTQTLKQVFPHHFQGHQGRKIQFQKARNFCKVVSLVYLGVRGGLTPEVLCYSK
jgi:hypothetical protein